MHTNLWFWIAFNAGVLGVLAIDLFGFQRKAHAPSTKEAAIWTAVCVALSLGFNALIWLWEGHAKALELMQVEAPANRSAQVKKGGAARAESAQECLQTVSQIPKRVALSKSGSCGGRIHLEWRPSLRWNVRA
jgi:hypothetical protein